LLELYAMVIAILGGALLVWAKINELRFRGKVRRAQVSEIHTQQLIEAFDIPDLDLPQLKTEKVLYVYMKNDGQVIDINNKKI
jgi:biofilm PGA synthesis protein PgaD